MKQTLAIPFEPGAGEDSITLELDDERNAGATSFAPGSGAYLRAITDQALTVRGSTRGTLALENANLRFEHEQDLTFVEAKSASLAYPCSRLIRFEWLGRGLGNVMVSGTTVTAAQEGYGILRVSYEVRYVQLVLSSVPAEGPVLAWVEDAAGRKGHATVTFEEAGEEPLEVVVRDICTGMVIAGAQVEIPGIFTGTTNAQGRVSVGTLPKGVRHDVRSSAVGYKDSWQDALANDSFTLE